MPRKEQQLHAWREPATPRPAATILLLRDGDSGLEVLMTRRSDTASFAPGAYVFPGGALDASDGSEQARRLSRVRASQEDEQRAFSVAAIREAFEELGVLLAYRADGGAASHADVERLDRSQDADFLGQLESGGYRMMVDQVWWLCHWVTDRDLPKRFDTRFFVARMPQPAPDRRRGRAVRTGLDNAGARARAARTGRLQHHLPDHAHAAPAGDDGAGRWRARRPAGPSAAAGCRARAADGCAATSSASARTSCPSANSSWSTPDGSIQHSLDWQSERVVPLLRHVHRLTAPNPGRMTGPGTNTYLIGGPGNWVVIDPGPDDANHVRADRRIRRRRAEDILCTHAHPDHAPGAIMLKRLTGAPILGAPAGPDFPSDWTFNPDRALSDGDRLRLAIRRCG